VGSDNARRAASLCGEKSRGGRGIEGCAPAEGRGGPQEKKGAGCHHRKRLLPKGGKKEFRGQRKRKRLSSEGGQKEENTSPISSMKKKYRAREGHAGSISHYQENPVTPGKGGRYSIFPQFGRNWKITTSSPLAGQEGGRGGEGTLGKEERYVVTQLNHMKEWVRRQGAGAEEGGGGGEALLIVGKGSRMFFASENDSQGERRDTVRSGKRRRERGGRRLYSIR